MANFDAALQKVLVDEGIFSDDKNDKGGKTKYGITEQKAREHGYTGEMVDFPKESAIEIYRQDYWNSLKLEQVNYQPLSEVLFQFGVNCGIRTACKSLQRALNVLNRNSISWLDAILDGVMGSKTLGIVNGLSEKDVLYTAIVTLGLQFERYIQICERDTTQEEFIRGWINRIGHYLQGLLNEIEN